MSTKTENLMKVEQKLQELLTFLQDYLPLANVHSNDFILHNIWEKYLSENIRQELDTMTDEQILNLPQKIKQYQNELLTEDYKPDLSQCDTDNWTFSSEYLNAAPRSGKMRKLHEIPIFPTEWKHASLNEFVQAAARCTLACSDLVSSMDCVYRKLKNQDNTESSLIIPNFMSSKKSHEVNIMSEVCSFMAKKFGVDVVIDVGSGKGYLSTQLVYQHGLCVLGVDAQTVNTSGAQKRASLLGKQWNGLVRQAEELKLEGKIKKRSKKEKKRLKNLHTKDKEGRNFIVEDIEDMSDEVLTNMQLLFDVDNSVKTDVPEKGISSKEFLKKKLNEPISVNQVVNCEQENMCLNCYNIDKPLSDKNRSHYQGHSIDVNKDTSDSRVYNPSDINTFQCSHALINEVNSTIKDSENSPPKIDHNNIFKNVENSPPNSGLNKISQDLEKSPHNGLNNISEDLEKSSQNSDTNNDFKDAKKSSSSYVVNCFTKGVEQSKLFHSVTTYVHDDMDILDLVREAGVCAGEITLMLTGLHTCGTLGSSLQKLFVNSNSTKVLCYVSCCYHLMNEEFVMSPVIDGHEDDNPGFPMSSLLQKQEVGLGRAARNFASQTLHRPVTELKAKSYPRSLLQRILYDVIGHVDSNWKGLRKLDQKCADMFEYVTKALEKLKLPTDKITTDIVSEYCNRYKDEERKLAVFLQIKSLLAPCIEAIVLLDRYCYLLEQDCVTDVMLVQMFDPATSPRCHAIIAFKD